MIEIDDLDACRRWVADPDRPPAAFQALDLRELAGRLHDAVGRWSGAMEATHLGA